MKTLLIYLPFVISFLTGCALFYLLIGKEALRSPLLSLSLAGGLGLGFSAYIGYINFMVVDRFSEIFQIISNIILFVLLLFAIFLFDTSSQTKVSERKTLWISESVYFLLLLVLFVPLSYMASFYPYGGWDAWAVWHFKSKFLFLAGDNWRNIFDPILWRSSPHYPLLLPLINVWGWAFQERAVYEVPMFSSLLFTFLTMALLVASLHLMTKKKSAFLTALVLLSLPFYAKTAISQYADIVLSYYALASLVCATLAGVRCRKSYAFLSGLFIGFLSFTKPEGLIAALIIMAGYTGYLSILKKGAERKNLLIAFLVGCAMTLIPSLLFYIFVAPANVTGINGFISETDPTTWTRVKTIFTYYAFEWISGKWNGLWIALFVFIILGIRKLWRGDALLFPFFLICYSTAVTLYYCMNTYFEILWWLSVTLNRILASILPIVLWWVFYCFWKNGEKTGKT